LPAASRDPRTFNPETLSHEPWRSVYDEPDWTRIPGMSRSPEQQDVRLYVCRCAALPVVHIDQLDKGEPMAERSAWRCDGHPPARVPLVLGDVLIDEGTDLHALLRELWIEGTTDSIRLADRVDGRLRSTPLEPVVHGAATRCLTDPDPRVRGAALGLLFPVPGGRGHRAPLRARA
jgi:hypothetical protein